MAQSKDLMHKTNKPILDNHPIISKKDIWEAVWLELLRGCNSHTVALISSSSGIRIKISFSATVTIWGTSSFNSLSGMQVL